MALTDQDTRPSRAMRFADAIARRFTVPALTPGRIWFAFAVAVITDGLQVLLGPVGWFLVDEVLDVIAMVLTCAALGFHLLLLPTFIVELLPVADLVPTWTGCTAAVVMLRKRAQAQPPPLPPKEIPGLAPAKPAESAEK
jgi:hypothetical protein